MIGTCQLLIGRGSNDLELPESSAKTHEEGDRQDPPPKGKHPIEISEQAYPGEPEAEEEEEETERRSIPDAWITAGDDWCLVIENKVLMRAKRKQLDGHLETAKRLGYGAESLRRSSPKSGASCDRSKMPPPWTGWPAGWRPRVGRARPTPRGSGCCNHPGPPLIISPRVL